MVVRRLFSPKFRKLDSTTETIHRSFMIVLGSDPDLRLVLTGAKRKEELKSGEVQDAQTEELKHGREGGRVLAHSESQCSHRRLFIIVLLSSQSSSELQWISAMIKALIMPTCPLRSGRTRARITLDQTRRAELCFPLRLKHVLQQTQRTSCCDSDPHHKEQNAETKDSK